MSLVTDMTNGTTGIMKLFLAVCLLALISGCSSDGSNRLATGSIAVNWSTVAAKVVASAPAGVITVRVIVSGPGIVPMLQKDFSAKSGSGTIDGVPAGSGRTVVAQGLDDTENVRYMGTATNLSVVAGQASNAGTIAMIVTSTGAFNGNIVLGTPTNTSIMANVFSHDQSGTVFIAYGRSPGIYDNQTTPASVASGNPLELTLAGLNANSEYVYRLYFLSSDKTVAGSTDEYSFRTARSSGSTFTFCIQGDSHPERDKNQFDADLYRRTLLTAAADKPDFYIAMGDDFSVDTLDPATVNAAKVTERYTIQRPYLGLIGRSAPVFLVNGNHEQAARYLLDGTPNNVAVWAQNARNSHYSQPASDGFYSGNTEQVTYIGLLRNHFAWTWGDALFVVIDPYWGSPYCVDNSFYADSKRSNLWDITHGDAQYQWLKTTLEQSKAKYKFVFAHHVMGTGRGGIELAGQYEWGGLNGKGLWEFLAYRPNWALPIHQLMAANHVTIFFQGHDHIWAKQQLDGVIYQTLPEPADPFYTLYNSDAFLTGDKFPNTGYTRVTVSPSAVKVDYVRTWLPKDEGTGKISGATAFSYLTP